MHTLPNQTVTLFTLDVRSNKEKDENIHNKQE